LGGAWLESPFYIQGTKHSVTNCRYGYLIIAGMQKTIEDWRTEHFANLGYNQAQIEEYMAIVDLARRIGKQSPKPEKVVNEMFARTSRRIGSVL